METTNKTYYICYSIFEKYEDIVKVSSTLDTYIKFKQWEQAHFYISTLNITDKEAERLAYCVDSYKRSC